MASKTKQRKAVVKNKLTKMGRDRKKKLARLGTTPVFPIHVPERHGELIRSSGREPAAK